MVQLCRKLIWLAVQPTPYNAFLFSRLKEDIGVPSVFYYAQKSLAELPWKQHSHEASDLFFQPGRKIQTEVLQRAWRERDTLFVVAGWEHPTKIGVIVIRALRRLPFVIWTDTVRPSTGGIRDRMRVALLRWVSNRAVAVLTTGRVGVHAFRQAGLAAPAVTLLNFPFFVPLPPPPIRRPSDGDQVSFLVCGRLVPRKGTDLAIVGFARCLRNSAGARARLFVAGTGPEELRLRALAEAEGVADQVTFLGWVEADEMCRVREMADVLVHVVPTHDPFPVVVLEAMASGLAVIASPLAGSALERVRSGNSGFLIDPKSDLIAATMARFLADPSLAGKMGRAARRVAEEWPVERGTATIRALLNPVLCDGAHQGGVPQPMAPSTPQ